MAPLSYAVGGCLGLIPVVFRDLRPVSPTLVTARLLEGAAAVAGFAGAFEAASVEHGGAALIIVVAGLALGACGYAVEELAPLGTVLGFPRPAMKPPLEKP